MPPCGNLIVALIVMIMTLELAQPPLLSREPSRVLVLVLHPLRTPPRTSTSLR